MDENKEKNLLDENEAEEVADKLSESEKEEVGEILQKLQNQPDDSNEPITDWDGLAEVGAACEEISTSDEALEEEKTETEASDEEELTEDDLCIKCEQRARYTELDENYPYCKVCREGMKKTRMNVWGVLAFISSAVSVFIGVIYGIFAIVTAMPVIKGDIYMKQGKYTSAISCYEEAIDAVASLNSSSTSEDTSTYSSEAVEIFDIGNKVYAKLIDAYFKSGAPAQAQSYYSALESSGVLESKKYAETKEYYDIYVCMMETYSSLQNTYAETLNNLYVNKDKNGIDDIKVYLDELEELKSDSSLDKYMVSYFQYLFCTVANDVNDEIIEYMLEIKSGGRAYEFIYSIELCSAYLTAGDYEAAEAICYESLKAAPENVGVYQYLMKSKIRQGDYDAALSLAEEAEEKSKDVYVGDEESTAPYTVMMEKAIVYALKGDEENALAAIEASYSTGNDNDNLNIYILLHYLYHVKGTEPTTDEYGEAVYDSVDSGYDQAIQVISYYGSYYGLSITENIQAIMDGKKTLEEVFVTGEVIW